MINLPDTDAYQTTETPERIILIWHGSGPNERHILKPLAQRLADDTSALVLVPNWNSESPDKGNDRLTQSLQAARQEARQRALPLTLIGWSLGGAAALDIALNPENHPQPETVIGLAAATEHTSPLSGRTPMDTLAAAEPPRARIHLIHGRLDDIVDIAEAEHFRDAFAERGWTIGLTRIDADHAGVVGCRFDDTRHECIPSDDAGARQGLQAAVAAVRGTPD